MHEMGEENGWERSIFLSNEPEIFKVGFTQLPNLIFRAGDGATKQFVEFFVATIRNRNTRQAYAQSIGQFFGWCEGNQLELGTISPIAVAAYIENLSLSRSAPTVKQHLAAIRMLFDWLVTGQVIFVVGLRTSPCGEEREDTRPLRCRSTPTFRLNRYIDADWPPRSRPDWIDVLQLCPSFGGRGHEC